MQHTGARFAQEISTSKPQGIRLGASWIAGEIPEVQAEFLSSLTKEEARALPYLFEFWALEHQLPPRRRPADMAHHGRAWCRQDAGRGRMGALAGRGAGAERSGQGKAYRSDRRDLRSGARGLALSGVIHSKVVFGFVLEKVCLWLSGELRGPGEPLDGLAARGVGVSGVSR